MLSNGAVDCCYVLMQGKYIYTLKMYISRIMHQNRAQNMIQCHDNNIWNICVLLIPIFDKIYKGIKQVKNNMWALHQKLVQFIQSRNLFCYVPNNEIKGGILGWKTPFIIGKPEQKFKLQSHFGILNPIIGSGQRYDDAASKALKYISESFLKYLFLVFNEIILGYF